LLRCFYRYRCAITIAGSIAALFLSLLPRYYYTVSIATVALLFRYFFFLSLRNCRAVSIAITAL
jgi:hypothetical protein